jgi:cytochrome c553
MRGQNMSTHREREAEVHNVIGMRTVVFIRAAFGAALLLAQFFPLSAIAQAAAAAGDNQGATYTGEKACVTCHALEKNHFV